jgi:tetratricopeptide (TPR) repeat protein
LKKVCVERIIVDVIPAEALRERESILSDKKVRLDSRLRGSDNSEGQNWRVRGRTRPTQDWILLFLTSLFVVNSSVSTLAQELRVNEDAIVIIGSNQLPPEAQERLAVARRLITSKQYLSASALLEELYIQNPDNDLVFNLLRTCYLGLQYYGKAEEVSRRFVEKYPDNIVYRLSLAEALAQQKKLDESRTVYQIAERMAVANNFGYYEVFLMSLSEAELYDELIRYTTSARTQTGKPDLYAYQRGLAYEKKHDYAFAAKEYHLALDDTLRTGSQAENRLLSLLEFPDASDATEKALLKELSLSNKVRGLRVLSTWYLKHDKFERAFEMALWQDSVDIGGAGANLHYFMGACQERQLYPQAIRIARYIRSKHLNSPLALETWFAEANASAALGLFDSALICFDTAFAIAPRPDQKSEILYKRGMMHLSYQHNFAKALQIFDSINRIYPTGMGYIFSRVAAPRCLVGLGEYDRALAVCDSTLALRLPDDLKEECSYYRAMTRLGRKEQDSARVALKKLTVDFPRGLFVNDALRLMSILDRSSEEPAILDLYVSAILYRFRGIQDSAAGALNSIATSGNGNVADIATWELAELNFNRNDSTASLTLATEMEEKFPESYYLPFALKLQADILCGSKVSAEKAKVIYRRLLEKYPNYPFIAEVRRRLQEMDEDRRIGLEMSASALFAIR